MLRERLQPLALLLSLPLLVPRGLCRCSELIWMCLFTSRAPQRCAGQAPNFLAPERIDALKLRDAQARRVAASSAIMPVGALVSL